MGGVNFRKAGALALAICLFGESTGAADMVFMAAAAGGPPRGMLMAPQQLALLPRALPAEPRPSLPRAAAPSRWRAALSLAAESLRATGASAREVLASWPGDLTRRSRALAGDVRVVVFRLGDGLAPTVRGLTRLASTLKRAKGGLAETLSLDPQEEVSECGARSCAAYARAFDLEPSPYYEPVAPAPAEPSALAAVAAFPAAGEGRMSVIEESADQAIEPDPPFPEPGAAVAPAGEPSTPAAVTATPPAAAAGEPGRPRYDEHSLVRFRFPRLEQGVRGGGGEAYARLVPRFEGPWRAGKGVRYRVSYLNPLGASRSGPGGMEFHFIGRGSMRSPQEVLSEQLWGNAYPMYPHDHEVTFQIDIENLSGHVLEDLEVVSVQESYQAGGEAGRPLGSATKGSVRRLETGGRTRVQGTFRTASAWAYHGSLEQTHVALRGKSGSGDKTVLADNPQAALVDPPPDF